MNSEPEQEANVQRRALQTEIVADHSIRIGRLEVQVADVRISLARLEGDMKELNRLTAEVRDNTGEVVTIAKSIKLIGKFATWGGAIATLIAAIYAARLFPLGG